MIVNIGTVDRGVRMLIGIVTLSLLFVLEGNARFLGLIGLIPIATVLVGYCPLYGLLGINTCGKKR